MWKYPRRTIPVKLFWLAIIYHPIHNERAILRSGMPRRHAERPNYPNKCYPKAKERGENIVAWRHFLKNFKRTFEVCTLDWPLFLFSNSHILAESDISEAWREMSVLWRRSCPKCGPNWHTSMRVLTICKLTVLILHDNKIKVWQQARNTAYFKCKTNKKKNPSTLTMAKGKKNVHNSGEGGKSGKESIEDKC